MKIKELQITGFRSLKQVSWTPGDLNVIIGANGTGKSNLLRFLEFISVAAKGELGMYVQSLGGMGGIVWDGQAPYISYLIKTKNEEFIADHYELRLDRLGASSSYRITREALAHIEYSEDEEGMRLEPTVFIDRDAQRAAIKDDFDDDQVNIEFERLDGEETLLSLAADPISENQAFLFQVEMEALSVHHDITVHRNAAVRQAAVTRFEKRVSPDGQNLVTVLHTLYTSNRDFRRSVDEAMRAAFGDDYEQLVFSPAADQRIQMGVIWRSLGNVQSAADLSDGTLRFLFLLAVLATPEPAPIIAIDEPEVGLHPAMLPIIAEYAADAALRSQVILTTHSPQLLDAFKEMTPTTTVMKWVNGETVLQILSGDDLNYWLQEYTLGALFKSGELERME